MAYALLLTIAILCSPFTKLAQSSVLLLPSSLAPEALSEVAPTAFSPADFSTDDFVVDWNKPLFPPVRPAKGELAGHVTAWIEPGSLQWVRVSEVLVIPRARVVIRASEIRRGTVRYAGFVQPFVVHGGEAEVRIPVALLSGDEHPIEVVVEAAEGQAALSGSLIARFQPRHSVSTPVILLDSSCSRFGLRSEWLTQVRSGPRGAHWAYIGCRLVHTEGEKYRTASFELIVFWDNIGQSMRVAGTETQASSASVWQLRLRSEPGYVDLGFPSDRNGDFSEVRLHYRVPKRIRRGAIGLGLGPYAFSFKSGGAEPEQVRSWILMPTLYGSFFLTDKIRLVAFDATTLNSQFISDFGVYMSMEYILALDRRVLINLMLGVHSIGFRSQGSYIVLPGAPQGFELIVSDFLGRARNLTIGGFIYPKIQDKAYYNTWVRWGSPRLFGEVNYISWQEVKNNVPYSASSAGVTLGMPLPALGFW